VFSQHEIGPVELEQVEPEEVAEVHTRENEYTESD
jgi:hypothetical protein